jgi:hypothetical protein
VAIVQISKIQHRRGLQQDLPQLASAELGWSVDQRRLFIGNGTLTEGAPTEGVTEILTEYSDFLGFLFSYTFKGTDAGYTSQTGATSLSPITRSIQSVLDEHVSVKDFGAAGDGTTDDTDAINRAIQQIYVSSVLTTHPNVRRPIYFPAGTYIVSSELLIPPYCVLVGDGKENTIIQSTSTTIIQPTDSLYQVGAYFGTNSAAMPTHIFVSGIKFEVTSGTSPVVVLDSTNDSVFENVQFCGAATTLQVVRFSSSVNTAQSTTFRNCTFDGGLVGIGATGYADTVRVVNCEFTSLTSYGIQPGTFISGLVSLNNYFSSTVATPVSSMSGNVYSFGDTFGSGDRTGIYSGALKVGTGRQASLSTGSNTITSVATGAGAIDYQINDSSNNYRYGVLKFNNTGSEVVFDDEYTESGTTLNANLWIHGNGSVICAATASQTFKYSIKQFV